jgi:hypothetical protein
MVRTIFDQPDAGEVRAQYARVVDTVAAKYPTAAEHLDQARETSWHSPRSRDLAPDLEQQPAGAVKQGDPAPHRRRRDLPQPRCGHPPRRRRLAEQTDEWTEQRRYMGPELLAKARKETIDDQTQTSAVQPQPQLAAA